jgi:hypothetical protein
MAIHWRQYPQSSVERWADLPPDIRQQAEAALRAESEPRAGPALTPHMIS